MTQLLRKKRKIINKFFNILSYNELTEIKDYLYKTYSNFHPKQGLSIVFDITKWCNLSCKGCATDSRLYMNSGKLPHKLIEINKEKILKILNQIKDYLIKKKINPFYINFGGGEPFLREDIIEILEMSYYLFGKNSISIDTNGTLISVDIAHKISKYVSNLGVSLDGLDNYHNYWRGTPENFNAFQRSFNFLKDACEYPELAKIIEVTSIANKNSLNQIPLLVKKISKIGVNQFSVHRAMPVGRFIKIIDEIPNNMEYLILFSQLLKLSKLFKMNIHFHHTIESIYATLLLGLNTYENSDFVYNPNKRSSIGIDTKGYIYFDPWSTEKPFSFLRTGPIINGGITFSEILESENSILVLAKKRSSKTHRCNKCTKKCSGGSRIAAAGNFLRNKEINQNTIMEGLEKVDPACPFYVN